MPQYRVTIVGRDDNAMADLVRRHRVGVIGQTLSRRPDGSYNVQAMLDPSEIPPLETAGYQVDVHEDADALGLERQAEVADAGAVTAEAAAPLALGGYLTVSAVEESLIALAAAPNNELTQLVVLPNRTWQDRTCRAIKIGKGAGQHRPGIYFTGGVHAREWGSPDILISFISRLAQAYRTNTGITIGGKSFTAAQIQTIVNTKNVYVFPQVNPDGRNHSMTSEPSWRKNRRPSPTGASGGSCVGVDINRNFDVLWDFTHHFHPEAPVRNSTDPCDFQVYVGPSPASEPETKNVVWMLDSFPEIGYFVDVHSFGEKILYGWGDDQEQSTEATMNFLNPAFDAKRGIRNDTAYLEYTPAPDRELQFALADQM